MNDLGMLRCSKHPGLQSRALGTGALVYQGFLSILPILPILSRIHANRFGDGPADAR